MMLSLQVITYARLLLACLFIELSSGLSFECCEPGLEWIGGSNRCKDNSTIHLSCIADSYSVDPNDDEEGFYRVNESNWLVVVNEENITIDAYAPDKFCQGYLNDKVRYLVCFPEEPSDAQEWHTILFGLCSTLSGIFLAFTLFTYIILPELRDLQDKAIMSLCASFMLAFFISGIPKLSNLTNLMDDTTCIVSGFIMYYTFLSAFFWLNVISLNIWRSVWFTRFKLAKNMLFIIYCALGWGVPLCFLVLTAVAQYVDNIQIKPAFGDGSCWINGYSAAWLYFYGPIFALLLLNIVYLGMTSWKLWHKYETFDCSHAKVLKTRCTMCMKLSLLMGVSWIFEVISFAFRETNQLFWLIPDLLNASQGLIIFIFFVVSRTKVRKLLAERRLCKIPFPKSWAGYKDHEKSEENFIDEIGLSYAS
ncbi:G-protein coupled receptor Mth2-like isoform X2 [Phymastichus coffea]|uniref:G-protein coupled receptor Mth2-like isoform X2 n=1 Tax=Phymastichus coffea TaxID=108790 RepID=UPI00273C1B5E|nr:G-protein coupled receptor Mth2-like isoform X2 [Phymastichus coffea]